MRRACSHIYVHKGTKSRYVFSEIHSWASILTLPDWSKFYCGGVEIGQHIKNTAVKFGLRDNIHFEARVVEARWNEETG